jgi:secondary thiamine-phosphate synthase enzyme
MRELSLETTRKTELVEITAQVRDAIAGARGTAVVLFVPHTTAGLVIQANGDLEVARDLEAALERIVDEGWSWRHTEEEGERNPWAHVRAALTATSVTIPLRDGELVLGAFQSIFLCEFDGPRSRTVYVAVV